VLDSHGSGVTFGLSSGVLAIAALLAFLAGAVSKSRSSAIALEKVTDEQYEGKVVP